MKILVTGASGFIGLHLLDKLVLTNHQILIISRNQSFLESLPKNKNLIKAQADLNNFSDINACLKHFNPDIVYHLAWEGIPDFSPENCRLNLNNSINLCNMISESKSCKTVIMSGK